MTDMCLILAYNLSNASSETKICLIVVKLMDGESYVL
jgi:hypothetical protein